jgi:diguanylate cyclase (GGDEF)-like protein
VSDKIAASSPVIESSEAELIRLRAALQCAGQVVFEWTLSDDRMVWSDGASAILGLNDVGPIDTGAMFSDLLDDEAIGVRHTVTKNQSVVGKTYRIEYQLDRPGGEACWVEERGTRLSGPDGVAERVVGLIRIITKQKNLEQRLTYLASFDELTGHFNRTRLREELGIALANTHRDEVSAVYLVIGVDDLAVINETYGFDIADEVIAQAGRVLKNSLEEGQIIGRSAGNKFGLILPDCDERAMMLMVDSIQSAVKGAVFRTRAGAVSMTVSIGGVLLPVGGRTSQEAMAHAEEALERAKNSGRDAFKMYRPSLQRESVRRRTVSIADQVVSALNERRLMLAYQPIISSTTGEIAQYECLLRMMRPDGTIVSAGDFIPVAEQLGLVRLVDLRVLELVVETLRRHPMVDLALNVSGMTATDPSWLGAFLSHIKANRDIGSRLTLELTETVAIHDIEASARFVASLRELGCKVAIDDFGAGYTSFRNLQMLDVDVVKIDGSFVRGLAQNSDNQLFVRTLVDLASNFNLETVAEWVGSEEEADLLREFGVDYFQGFFYGQPEINPDWLTETSVLQGAKTQMKA